MQIRKLVTLAERGQRPFVASQHFMRQSFDADREEERLTLIDVIVSGDQTVEDRRVDFTLLSGAI